MSDLLSPVREMPTRSANSPLIRFDRVAKRFGDVTAVDGVSLDIHEGEFFCLLGPSGCG
ncbi:MAG: putrescine transport system ATP-binding protein, partial [Sphingomonadales bacterium]|nr:putrescine transport system ATP-binding protein [Sphingomonadales bacterium]